MTTSELRVPDAKLLASVQKLCSYPHPYEFPESYEALFVEALRESCRWHYERSAFYKRLCELRNFRFERLKTFHDLADIPFIPSDFFKVEEVLSIDRSQVFLHLTSSGTTGQKSQVFFDEWSIKSAQNMVDRIFEYYQWVSPEPSHYLLYTYEPEQGSKLGTAYTDNFLCKYSKPEKVVYALKSNGKGGHDFDLYGCIEALNVAAREQKALRIFGFPSFFHFTLTRMKERQHPPLKLHPASLVFLGGGWKTHANESIPKDQFYREINEQLGIPMSRIRDGFGSVEHCIPYIECRHHRFHVPLWSKVLIRDYRTLQVLGYEKEGFLNFISPYITSMPAQNVLMGDRAILHSAESCACGVPTDSFEILGRAGLSKNKSCAVAASELLRELS